VHTEQVLLAYSALEPIPFSSTLVFGDEFQKKGHAFRLVLDLVNRPQLCYVLAQIRLRGKAPLFPLEDELTLGQDGSEVLLAH